MKHKRILKFLFVLIFLVGLSGVPGRPGLNVSNTENQVNMQGSVGLSVYADDGAGDPTPRDAVTEDERLGSDKDWLYAGYTVIIIIIGIIIDVIIKSRKKKKLKAGGK